MAFNGVSPNHSPKVVVSSPWSQIVAPSSPHVADSSDVNSAFLEDSDNAVGHNVNSTKRPVWNKPSNAASSSVMGADSWPALSESARAPAKSLSPLPSELLPKGSVDASSESPLQGTGSVVATSQKEVRDNISGNNAVQSHPKSFKRNNSNTNTSSNGGHPLPQLAAPQGSMTATGSHSHSSSPKDHQPRPGFVSNNDHPQQQQRNSFRHRNGGHHQRGDGGHHHNYGGRRDQQDRGNQDWNTHRNFNGRDNYMSPRYFPRFLRPPPPPNPAQLFPPPPPIRSFGGAIGFHELPPQVVYVPPPPLESLRAVPFMAPLPPNAMFFQPPDPQLHTKIVFQIDYYFSNENLIKDIYLRQNMDDQGWVPVNLIAGFKKVKHLTDNIQIVLDAVRTSSVVEVQGDKIRRRNDWRRWIMPPVQLPNVSSSQIGSQTVGQLAEQVQSIALETNNTDDAGGLDVSQSRSFGDLNSQVGIQVSDHSISARN